MVKVAIELGEYKNLKKNIMIAAFEGSRVSRGGNPLPYNLRAGSALLCMSTIAASPSYVVWLDREAICKELHNKEEDNVGFASWQIQL
jgi:hypothetical protein